MNEEETSNKILKSGMSRGAQTVWIVSAILLVGSTILYQMTRLPHDHPYAKCQTLFGQDENCILNIEIDAEIKAAAELVR